MFVDEYGYYKGRKKAIETLGKNSKYKVDVQCPECKKIRRVTYLSVTRAGHHTCISCSHKMKNTIPIKEGSVFGRLTVIGQSENARKVICSCECGVESEKFKHLLKSGATRSCGCLKKESFNSTPRATRERHWNWKGGISGERHIDMQTKRYKDWRLNVFKRDDYTCLKCGQWGGTLNAHHIEDYASSLDKRFDVDNGSTFCQKCHIIFHREYGRIRTTREMFDEYITESEVLTTI